MKKKRWKNICGAVLWIVIGCGISANQSSLCSYLIGIGTGICSGLFLGKLLEEL